MATAPTRKKHVQPIYLEQDRAEMLDELAGELRQPKAQLLRNAVDDLLIKHGKLKRTKVKPR